MMIELSNKGKRVLVNTEKIIAVLEKENTSKQSYRQVHIMLENGFEVLVEESYDAIKILLEDEK